MELPEWYDQLAADEAKLDAIIVEQSKPRHYCPVCGLFHRAVCPSGPDVADILSAPTPEPSFDPPCEEDDES